MPDGQAEDPEQGPQGWPKCTNDIKNRAFRFVLRPGQAGGGGEWEGVEARSVLGERDPSL